MPPRHRAMRAVRASRREYAYVLRGIEERERRDGERITAAYTPTTTIATRRLGSANIRSTKRMIMASIRPPR